MTADRPSSRRFHVATAVLLVAAILLQVVRDRGWAPYEPPNSVLWVQSGAVARRLALSFDNLASDLYWIRAVVYYGSRRRTEGGKNFDQMYPLLELVTALDPHFKVAYRFGALFLSEPTPGGPGRPDLALELLRRAVEQDDGKWEYYEDAGFVHYWWLRDYAGAAEWFRRGSERPGAPNWLVGLAATTLATGGNRASSRLLWQQLLNDTDAAYIQNQARHRLLQLDAMDGIDALAPILQRFINREKRIPRSWQELAAAERLRAVPADPTGVPFVFDPAVGRIDVSKKSILWPLPLEPMKGPALP